MVSTCSSKTSSSFGWFETRRFLLFGSSTCSSEGSPFCRHSACLKLKDIFCSDQAPCCHLCGYWGQKSCGAPWVTELTQFSLVPSEARSKEESCKLKLHLWIDFLISNIGSSIPPGPGLSVCTALCQTSGCGCNCIRQLRVKRKRERCLDQRYSFNRI